MRGDSRRYPGYSKSHGGIVKPRLWYGVGPLASRLQCVGVPCSAAGTHCNATPMLWAMNQSFRRVSCGARGKASRYRLGQRRPSRVTGTGAPLAWRGLPSACARACARRRLLSALQERYCLQRAARNLRQPILLGEWRRGPCVRLDAGRLECKFTAKQNTQWRPIQWSHSRRLLLA